MGRDTVDGVLARLDRIVERARSAGSRSGYFPAVYRTVTAKVAAGIDSGFFDDADRMERLTATFAGLYFDALDAAERAAQPPRSWQVAFAAAGRRRPLVLQHVLAGINAHINLDLGVATARTAPGPELGSLRRDFDRINELLALQIEEVERRITAVSPWIGLLRPLGDSEDDVVVRFSLSVSRAQSWRFASELATLPSDSWKGAVRVHDRAVARLGRRVLDPGPLLGAKLLVIRARETSDVRRCIDALSGVPAPALETVETRVRRRNG